MESSTYSSPFSWRYGSKEMRTIFSEQHKYELWRKVWVALARAQHKAGLVNDKELKDLEKNEKKIDIEMILELEKETKHDVMAAIKEFAAKATIGGGKIHLGATSMDINDNADILRFKEAFALIEKRLKKILDLLSQKIEKYADFECMAFTHLQPAEPTTLGYRFAMYAQDLLINYELLKYTEVVVKGKGIKGAVGTAASYTRLLEKNRMKVEELERLVMEDLGIDAVLIASQVYPRQFDYLITSTLAAIASSAAKFAGDVRILQSPMYGALSEPFGKKQVGSSAMPFKRNPVNSEKICSLARYVVQIPPIALESATLSYLERTLDDSANRRIILPEIFLTVDEILIAYEKVISGLVINEKRIKENLAAYAPFAATEAIMMEAVKHGADRQEMHDVLKNIAMEAWGYIQEGKPNHMEDLMLNNKHVSKYLKKPDIKKLLDISSHTGNAPRRARLLVKKIQKIV